MRALVLSVIILGLSACCFESENLHERRMVNESSDTLWWTFSGEMAKSWGMDSLILLPGMDVFLDKGRKKGKDRDFDCATNVTPAEFTVTVSGGKTLKKTIYNGFYWDAASEQTRCVGDWDCAFIIRDADLQ